MCQNGTNISTSFACAEQDQAIGRYYSIMYALNTFLVLPFAILIYNYGLFLSRVGCSLLVTGDFLQNIELRVEFLIIKYRLSAIKNKFWSFLDGIVADSDSVSTRLKWHYEAFSFFLKRDEKKLNSTMSKRSFENISKNGHFSFCSHPAGRHSACSDTF